MCLFQLEGIGDTRFPLKARDNILFISVFLQCLLHSSRGKNNPIFTNTYCILGLCQTRARCQHYNIELNIYILCSHVAYNLVEETTIKNLSFILLINYVKGKKSVWQVISLGEDLSDRVGRRREGDAGKCKRRVQAEVERLNRSQPARLLAEDPRQRVHHA